MKPLIYITGAGGYLGSALLQKLLQQRKYNILTTFDDINEIKEDGVKADIIIHLAAKLHSPTVDVDDMMNTNFEAVKKVVETKSKKKCHVVFLSSDYVFKGDGIPKYEHSLCEPETIYGRTKLLAEEYLLNNADIDTTILRTSMLYGYKHSRRVNFFQFLNDKLSKGEKIELFTNVFSSPTYVEDLSNFIIKAIEEKMMGVMHACGNSYINRYDLGKLYCSVNNFDPDLLAPVEMFDNRIPLAPHIVANPAFASSATSLEQGITNCRRLH